MMATTLRHLDQLLHTVERGRALNVDELGRLPVRLYGPDGQPLFTEQNPAHVKGEVTLTGQLRGLADDRPDPGDVDVGTTYWSVDTGVVSVSTGTEWRSLGVV